MSMRFYSTSLALKSGLTLQTNSRSNAKNNRRRFAPAVSCYRQRDVAAPTSYSVCLFSLLIVVLLLFLFRREFFEAQFAIAVLIPLAE